MVDIEEKSFQDTTVKDGSLDGDSRDGYHAALKGVTKDDKADMMRMGKTQELKVQSYYTQLQEQLH
jgi:hypothetical protein